jgi:hypothetical protein
MAEKVHSIARLSTDEISEIVDGVTVGSIEVLDEYSLSLGCALPISLGALNKWTKAEIECVGWIIGREKDSLPRSVNGRAMYGKVQLVHKDDVRIIAKACIAIAEAKKKAMADILPSSDPVDRQSAITGVVYGF